MIPRVPVVSSSASNSRYTFALTISRIFLENDDRFLLPLYPFNDSREAEENTFRSSRDNSVADPTTYLEVSSGRNHSSSDRKRT